MGWSESVHGCKKHPTLNKTPGVCSSCLRERLFQLADSSNKRKTTTTIRLGTGYRNDNNSFSASDFPSSDGGASPVRRHLRNASEAMANFLFSGGGGLRKSRSIAVVPRSASLRFGSEVVKKGSVGNNGKKKGGFWSKLINGATGKRKNEVLKHSMTFRESLESRI
ncbi:hypothetical protein TIFTF001_004392 [Ficus carica]|uniref:Uncharacterized protein n=1 Tax=Ficus carica TaxID=3494 RepID=A0AA87ZCT9_FICCA|nr:hypothetical protein TIFTF001_004392 [Ficus carica]